MKPLILSIFTLSTLLFAEIQMPKDQTFYISGIAFDTKTYCADFKKVIEAQAQKIKALEQEIAQLRAMQQRQLSQKRKEEHQQALKGTDNATAVKKTKSRIIISDKPIH